MAQEIIYTSAERGLRQGSRGFCTVVCTEGMPFALIERLESMSGYRHAFSLSDPKAAFNPVNFSHVTMRLSGTEIHIVSRVGDAGQDYSGRTNKLAHHLVLDDSSLASAGPARLLSEPGVIVEQWDGRVQRLPERVLPKPKFPTVLGLSGWKTACGDNGWAGKIAERLQESSGPVSVIFSPGTDTLLLTREVLDLIPTGLRWNITFSTYFTRLLPGSNCQLRFVLNNTSEATFLRNDATSTVIDLSKQSQRAVGGPLVELARQREFAVPDHGIHAVSDDDDSRNEIPTLASQREIRQKHAGATGRSLSEGTAPKSSTSLSSDKLETYTSDRRFVITVVTAVAAFVAIGILVALTPFLLQSSSSAKFDQIVERSSAPANAGERDATPLVTPSRPNNSENAAADAVPTKTVAEQQQPDAARALAEKDLATRVAREKAAEELRAAKQARKIEWHSKGPFVLIRNDATYHDAHDQWLFELPRPSDTIEARPLPLNIADPNVELSLYDGASFLFANCSYQLDLAASPGESDVWLVTAKSGANEIPLARYQIERIPDEKVADGSANCLVHFQWLSEAARETEAAELLRWWPLQVQVGESWAVILQRAAEFPDRLPTWSGILASEPFLFPKTSALKALHLQEMPAVEFALEVVQDNEKPQLLSMKLASGKAQDNPPDALNQQVVSLSRYFALEPDIQLRDQRPEITPELLGFGKMDLVLAYQGESLALTPEINLSVRLPKKKYLESLPSDDVQRWLNDIIHSPVLLSQFDPEQLDQRLQLLDQSHETLSSDPIKWHSQEVKKLPLRKSFFTDHFRDLTRRALKSVKSQIPALRDAAIRAQTTRDALYVRDASGNTLADRMSSMGEIAAVQAIEQAATTASRELNFAMANFAPRIEPFETAMDAMNRRVTEAINDLLKDYDGIKAQVDLFIQIERHFTVKSRLLTILPINEAENGPNLYLYFFESQ